MTNEEPGGYLKHSRRFWKFQSVSESKWKDWKWQLQNRLQNGSRLTDYFPNASPVEIQNFKNYAGRFTLGLTPYALSLLELDRDLNPINSDPIWRQVRYFDAEAVAGDYAYDGTSTNWELPSEFPTRILQHKYPDRAIIRIVNHCLGYCSFCYLTARILDKESKKSLAFSSESWKKTLDYLRAHEEIRDVLISGGDPLALGNSKLDQIFEDLSGIDSIKSVRLNTRALSFNPFRLNRELAEIFKRHRLNSLEIHLVHPREITAEFDEALAHFDECGYRPRILWRSPLLKGINDSIDVLEDMLIKLYQRRVVPYYLFHAAPFTVARSSYATSIRKGIDLLLNLRRRIPGPAFPRYTLFHPGGKQDIPLELGGTPHFQFTRNSDGDPIVRFWNWRGEEVTYPDVLD